MGNRRKGIGSNTSRRDRKRNRYATNLSDRITALSRRSDPRAAVARSKAERLLKRSKVGA